MIITHKPLTDLPQILIGEHGETTGKKYGKLDKILIYNQAGVNGGSNYNYLGNVGFSRLYIYKRKANLFKGLSEN